MKNRILISLAALSMLITACNNNKPQATPHKEIDFSTLEENTFTPTKNTGELGEFDLISPADGVTITEIGEFRWSESENAESYTLYICSSQSFASDIESVDYYEQENITTTSFTVASTLMYGNQNYYWKVEAVNSAGKKYSTSTYSFYILAQEVDEVAFDLGEADDWSLHPLGSYADIAIDNSNFFNNDQESLVVSFKTEDTKRGIPESDGWIIVTRTIERSIYGTDALFFNMFYSGQDASLVIRLVDRDNEYWYIPIQVSNNAKQSVIVQFEDFIQRTGDVTVANEKFDYERIKYFEVVFEKSFGDGVFLMSGVKAIKFDNYRDRFIDKIDFSTYQANEWTTEPANTQPFVKEINGTELILNHYNSTTEEHEKINGYGFAKLVVNRYFYKGDSIKIKVKYTGTKGSNVIMRIYEEDKDRWSIKIPYSQLTSEYQEMVIPFGAFAKSDIQGDGKRQFYYIINIQFGCEGQYGNGTVCFKDFEIVKKSDYRTEEYRTIANDGIIEDFESYHFSPETYLHWDMSDVNKDEYIAVNTSNKIGPNNKACGQFEYKADMQPAEYTIPIKVSQNFNALSLWIKDASVKYDPYGKYNHLTSISPEMKIVIDLVTKERYEYVIPSVDRYWYNYVIPFSSFTLGNEDDLTHVANKITVGGILDVGFTFQYFYYDSRGNAKPTYANNNPVYIDNMKFMNSSVFEKTLLEKIIDFDGDVAMMDDLENYANNDELLGYWVNGTDFEYQHMELSSEVSSRGGTKSVAMQYRNRSDSPSYYFAPTFAPNTSSRGVKVDIKGDGVVTIYLNVYMTISDKTYQYRATINNVAASWNTYTISFDKWAIITSGTTRAMSKDDMNYIYRFSVGMVYPNGATTPETHTIYFDNFRLDKTIEYETYNVSPINQEVWL